MLTIGLLSPLRLFPYILVNTGTCQNEKRRLERIMTITFYKLSSYYSGRTGRLHGILTIMTKLNMDKKLILAFSSRSCM